MRRVLAGWLMLMAIYLQSCSSAPAEDTTGSPAPSVSVTPAASTPVLQDDASSSQPDLPEVTSTLAMPSSLTTEELQQLLNPLFQSDDCLLPCYNGLVPGQSGISEALNFYAALGLGPQDLMPGDYAAIQDGSGHLRAFLNKASDQVQAESRGMPPSLVDLGFEGGIVKYLYVGWQYLPEFSNLVDLNSRFGPPDRFELAVDLASETPGYALFLVYSETHMGLAYYGDLQMTGEGGMVCLDNDRISAVFLGIFAPDIPAMAGLPLGDMLLPVEASLQIPFLSVVEQVGRAGCFDLTAEQLEAW
nr:hypothetical protein [Anaerolineae bacterium]